MEPKMGSHTVCGYCGKSIENPSCGVCFECQVKHAAQGGTQAATEAAAKRQPCNSARDAICINEKCPWNLKGVCGMARVCPGRNE